MRLRAHMSICSLGRALNTNKNSASRKVRLTFGVYFEKSSPKKIKILDCIWKSSSMALVSRQILTHSSITLGKKKAGPFLLLDFSASPSFFFLSRLKSDEGGLLLLRTIEPRLIHHQNDIICIFLLNNYILLCFLSTHLSKMFKTVVIKYQ